MAVAYSTGDGMPASASLEREHPDLAADLARLLPAEIQPALTPAPDSSVDDEVSFQFRTAGGPVHDLDIHLQIGDGYIAINRNVLDAGGAIEAVDEIGYHEWQDGGAWLNAAARNAVSTLQTHCEHLGLSVPQATSQPQQDDRYVTPDTTSKPKRRARNRGVEM